MLIIVMVDIVVIVLLMMLVIIAVLLFMMKSPRGWPGSSAASFAVRGRQEPEFLLFRDKPSSLESVSVSALPGSLSLTGRSTAWGDGIAVPTRPGERISRICSWKIGDGWVANSTGPAARSARLSSHFTGKTGGEEMGSPRFCGGNSLNFRNFRFCHKTSNHLQGCVDR